MFSKIALAVLATSLLTSASFARELNFKEGVIGAQTEILGDSNIAPKCSHITAKLNMDDAALESLKGEISMDLINLKSENEKRDEHMYEALHVKEHPSTMFKLKEVKKEADGYHLLGTLTLNKQIKEINTKADITDQSDLLKLKGGFSIKMSEFGIEPPTLLFLSVRDEVVISYDLTLAKN
ncbi:YceI family protein [Sulfurospirillum oryzae]|uniref:YceI family protein n=1 Tax=Sulfurospirillum oryzae TaxID=2976535 RepID=UPI0021E795BF|nr:YceI family protein [Sulfurospirillum oryzae]